MCQQKFNTNVGRRRSSLRARKPTGLRRSELRSGRGRGANEWAYYRQRQERSRCVSKAAVPQADRDVIVSNAGAPEVTPDVASSSDASAEQTVARLRLLWEHRRLLFRGALFFQAEDGIRDLTVTGVQTCALPI